ncbi:Fe-S protein assembly co-chaperone HscB [Ramlibacter sp. PS4R-6]|uniref:Fe-S protein assembly co-chaperone HscB n=1 Tax=Ramlibacter sp. PS4R-6 TaxID=3133438 RepID=UPI0030AF4461
MNLQSNDFELFGVPEQFAQDLGRIDERWKDLQREAHPDRFAAQGAAAQRIAMQWSVRINEAYKRLKDPLKRAAYLCELRGSPIDPENNTAMPATFLVEQMEWREALEEARSIEDVDRLEGELQVARRDTVERVRRMLDDENDPRAAAQQVRALMFIERFAHDVEGRAEQLGQ